MRVTLSTALLAFVPSFCDAQANAGSSFTPARPPAIPLAVKSPYLSTWQQAGSDGGNGGYLAGQWPTFWAGQIVGWAGLIRVDNLTYTWMGAPTTSANNIPPVVNQTSFEYTSTRSVFNMDVAGLIKMTLTFLSNVAPNDMMRQSFPISFMEVTVESADGSPHEVQLYTDISAEWISGDRSAIAQWRYGASGGDALSSSTALEGSVFTSSTPLEGSVFTSSTPLEGSVFTSTTALEGSVFTTTTAAANIKRQDNDPDPITTYGTRTDFDVPASVTHPAPTIVTESPFVRPLAEVSPAFPKTTAPPIASPTPNPTSGFAYHQVYRQTQLLFSETADQTEYGNWYYLTDNTADMTHPSGAHVDVRAAFQANGYLANTEDTNYRAINDAFPVFAYAVDFGNVTSAVSHKWAIALAQQENVQFLGYSGNETLPSLWTQYHATDEDALSFYFNDYETTSIMATDVDNMVSSDSTAAAGTNYSLITTLALRQAFGGLSYVNTTDAPAIFLKEISSNGNMNTVDVLFPFHPLSIYLNPAILRMLLEPLFIQQEAGNWPFAYSIHDIGARFPNATGHADGMDEMQPLEECGNMIIMALAYAQRTNDTAYLDTHYSILRQWNDYLVNDSLVPAAQISTDDFAGAAANQTNLALKGIIGIQAMAQIATLTGNDADGANFSAIAQDYITQWQTLGTAIDAQPPHTTLNYTANETYSLLYNLFPDRELGLDLVSQSVYDMQSAFYPTVAQTYGVPLDTRHSWAKSDWELFAAAVASTSTRDLFVNAIADFISQTPTSNPLTDLYDAGSGELPPDITFTARPTVGGFFAFLALNSAP